MSSQISPSESETERVASYRRSKFVRSASLERIKKFNTYICSQNFYILPAILAWLKSSQNMLHANVTKCTVSIKSQIFNSYVCKTIDSQCRCAYNTILYPTLIKTIVKLRKISRRIYSEFKTNLLGLVVYLTITAIFTQLLALLIVLSMALMPGGLVFMITCIALITHLNFVCLNSTLKTKVKKHIIIITDTISNNKRPSRKDLISKRTISNINFF